ncbi:CGH_1_HP_G0099250.mRNA.1.CDS.1 [Saccharomyces cerevisiae]|nr:CGH_1_HP_G0099250.mRNA.1.CDS.1 [Saccharomyces cerevisiae]CAI6946042.1 CGH_1_HP_G0099250.mRNA.1.CDS.1 [Saccharomyces cerevisiae]
MKEFMHRVNVLQNENDGDLSHWFPFFCGDFNSQPFDTPYLSMTSKPVHYRNRAKTVIECALHISFPRSVMAKKVQMTKKAGILKNMVKINLRAPFLKNFMLMKNSLNS